LFDVLSYRLAYVRAERAYPFCSLRHVPHGVAAGMPMLVHKERGHEK
jgi:hypothetical protein